MFLIQFRLLDPETRGYSRNADEANVGAGVDDDADADDDDGNGDGFVVVKRNE